MEGHSLKKSPSARRDCYHHHISGGLCEWDMGIRVEYRDHWREFRGQEDPKDELLCNFACYFSLPHHFSSLSPPRFINNVSLPGILLRMTWGVISICRACHPPLPCILVQLSGVGDKPGPFSPGRNHCYIPTDSTADFLQMPALSPLPGLCLHCSLCLEPSSLPFLLFKAKLECHIFHEALSLPLQHNILYIYHLFILS